tara:strand:+ start:79 stop:378 length:300 start_codon:yes stop_codon:yes gene_type:complete
MTTILNIARFELRNPTSEHLLDVHKHLFLHFGMTHVSRSSLLPNELILRMEVPADDGVDALVEWEKAQDTVYDAYRRTEEILWGVKRDRDLIWTPCKNR